MNSEAASLNRILTMSGAELSFKARMGYVALLLASAAMTVVVIPLWLTEPSLPARTQAAFGAIALIGLSWCALACWVLRARRPLFARDRLIAGRMAMGFTALFALAALTAVILSASPAAYGALAMGVAMLAVATAVLVGARRRFMSLVARREELQRALSSGRR
jgi:hypothetical protein